MNRPRVAIVGGGLLGLTVAYRLASTGAQVTVYESAGKLGGLAATTDLGGYQVDRFYHVTLPTDDRVRGLATELGLGDRFRFRRTGVGFWHDGGFASMSSARELLTFPALTMTDRLRLGAFVARCQLKSDHEDLDRTPLDQWLIRQCGRRTWERLWRPLLDSKFDGRFDDLPATYLWARTRRMSKTRERGSHEVMGTLEGGYQVLVDALAAEIERFGGTIHLRTPVRAVASSGGRAIGVVSERGLEVADQVVLTQLPPVARELLPEDLLGTLGPDRCRYLGVVCLVMRLPESLSPYYTLNITDRSVPLTTVVETTHVVDPERVGGTLVYVPKYVNPDSRELERSDDEIREAYMGHVRTMFPAFRPERVLASQVARAALAEPVHTLEGAGRTAEMFPAPGLALASTAQIYPELVNAQAVIGAAERLVAGLRSRIVPTVEEVAA